MTDALVQIKGSTLAALMNGVGSAELNNGTVALADLTAGVQTSLTRADAISLASVSGATKSAIALTPAASATTASINYHKLFAIGDVTGTAAYGMGDPAKPTTGVMTSFGRTVATSAAITDTSMDVRFINRLVNVGANNAQGLYVKAKNYSTGTIGGNLIGQFIEVVNEGTVSGTTIGLKIGSDSTTLATDILLHNGTTIANTDADTLTITEGTVNIVGVCKATSLTLGSTAVTATAAQLNSLATAQGGLAAILTAGLGGSATVTKVSAGDTTIVALNATKARACLVVVSVDEDFATGDNARTLVTVGETDAPTACFANTFLPNATVAGTVKVAAFTNTANKAITVSVTPAAGTGTGGCTVTVIAIPTT